MRVPAVQYRSVYLIVVGLVSALCVVKTIYGYDTLWQIPTGQWILSHGAVPYVDIFSSTKLGAPWTDHEWLSQVILAGAYDIAGWAGVLLLTCGFLAAAFAILAGFLYGRPYPVRGLILILLGVALCMSAFSVRPHALTAWIYVVWSVALVSAVEAKRTPTPWLLLLMTLWANLHGSFIVGLGFAALMATEAVVIADGYRDRMAEVGRWGAFVVLAVLASVLTPHGVEGLLFPIQAQQMPVMLSVIDEWKPTEISVIFHPLFLWVAVFVGFTAVGTLRLHWVRAVGLLVLLFIAFKHHRHVVVLGLLGPVLLATPFCGARSTSASAAPEASAGKGSGLAKDLRRLSRVGISVAVAAGLLLGAWLRMKPFHPEEAFSAEKALRFASQAGLSGAVLNEYGFGGTLIFHGIRPFIDGRADMYGDDFLRSYLDAVQLRAKGSPAPFFRLLEQHRIQWTLLKPRNPALAVLAMSGDWERVYGDEWAVIYKRVPRKDR